jgi:hypothetical protein
MSSMGLIEMVLTFSIPLAWAVWELRKLRREQARDREKAEAEADKHE